MPFTVTRANRDVNNTLGRKVAKVWNADFRPGNYCTVCRVDVGGHDEKQQTEQMTNHLKKRHKDAYEAFLTQQQKLNQPQEN